MKYNLEDLKQNPIKKLMVDYMFYRHGEFLIQCDMSYDAFSELRKLFPEQEVVMLWVGLAHNKTVDIGENSFDIEIGIGGTPYQLNIPYESIIIIQNRKGDHCYVDVPNQIRVNPERKPEPKLKLVS